MISRHVLSGMRHALPKILCSMDLTDPTEAAQAVAMLEQWPELCVEDALQLLSKRMPHPTVRAYAVEQLDRQLSDEDLQLYLLQLVQALRYEQLPCRCEIQEEQVKHMVRLEKQVTTPTVTTELEAVSDSIDLVPEAGEPEVIEEEVTETVQHQVFVPQSPLLKFICTRCSIHRSLASLCLNYIHVETNQDTEEESQRNERRYEWRL